jgi:hypothetical protein
VHGHHECRFEAGKALAGAADLLEVVVEGTRQVQPSWTRGIGRQVDRTITDDEYAIVRSPEGHRAGAVAGRVEDSERADGVAFAQSTVDGSAVGICPTGHHATESTCDAVDPSGLESIGVRCSHEQVGAGRPTQPCGTPDVVGVRVGDQVRSDLAPAEETRHPTMRPAQS